MASTGPRYFIRVFLLTILAGGVLFGFGLREFRGAGQALKSFEEARQPIEARSTEALDVAAGLVGDLDRFHQSPDAGARLDVYERIRDLSRLTADISRLLLEEMKKALLTNDPYTRDRALRMLGSSIEANYTLAELQGIVAQIESGEPAKEEEKDRVGARITRLGNSFTARIKEVKDNYARAQNKEYQGLEERRGRGLKMALIGLPLALLGLALMAYRVGYVRATRRNATARGKAEERG
ncbi:MAG TPA: hypothetical protein VM492_06415 [Sumerlaeia bacterium]|nr:hypothetical protein [Sumerlaeia bacterium]